MRFFDRWVGRGSKLGMSRLTTVNRMQTIGIKMLEGSGSMSDQIKTEHKA